MLGLRQIATTILTNALVIGAPATVVHATTSSTSLRDYADSSCVKHVVDVSVTSNGPADAPIATWLCGAEPGRTVQVTVSGTTYNHLYWDFPLDPSRYSYVRAQVAAGYTVLNFDRICIGESTHLPALECTGATNALVLHQLISDLRSGYFGIPFREIVTVGHSQGSGITLLEAETYRDVDGLIITGLPGAPMGPSTALIFASLIPAQMDPEFVGDHLPPGYLTTRPGTRKAIFYSSTADPAVIAEDEATKDVFPVGEVTVLVALAQTREVNVPVFSLIGEDDGFFCTTPCSPTSPVLELQKLMYGPQTCLESSILPNAGHDINLHPNAQVWFSEASEWMAQRIGNGASHPPTDVCVGAANPM
jgi:pimeloyl-ACP methyl ester carboxylesterase